MTGQTPADQPLADRRFLVIGGSSGIGRAVATAAFRGGARVGVNARRRELLDALVAEQLASLRHAVPAPPAEPAGPRLAAFPADCTDPSAFSAALNQALAWLGGLDVLIYATGAAPLATLRETSAPGFLQLLATNVVGAAQALSHCLATLERGSRPTAVLVSTDSVVDPKYALVPYAASKAALETVARGLREEEPWLRVVTVKVGPTATPFADGWDPKRAGAALERWAQRGQLDAHVMRPEHVAGRILRAAENGPDDVEVIGEVA